MTKHVVPPHGSRIARSRFEGRRRDARGGIRLHSYQRVRGRVRVDGERKEYSVLYITPSERLALRLLAEGRPDGDVANALGVGVCPAPLDSRLSVLFARMGVTGKLEAVASALRRGILVVESGFATSVTNGAKRLEQRLGVSNNDCDIVPRIQRFLEQQPTNSSSRRDNRQVHRCQSRNSAACSVAHSVNVNAGRLRIF
jgi:hypothetical protein